MEAAGRVQEKVFWDAISRQLMFTQLKGALSGIEYDRLTDLALLWRIAKGVAIDPRVAKGKPVVGATGIHTWVIAKQLQANGGDAALIADLFGLSEGQVLDAARFEDQLERAA